MVYAYSQREKNLFINPIICTVFLYDSNWLLDVFP